MYKVISELEIGENFTMSQALDRAEELKARGIRCDIANERNEIISKDHINRLMKLGE